MTTSYGYELDFTWDHPWPRAPVPKNEDERLADLEGYHILDTAPEEKFNKLCRIACKEMKCPISAVSFIDKSKQWFKANSGLTQAAIPRDVALCAHTIMNPRNAVVVLDTTTDERFKNNPLVTRASSVKFYAAVPLVTARGTCIGSVFVFDVKTHTSCDTKLLQKIAAKVMKYLDERLRPTAELSQSVGPTALRPIVQQPLARSASAEYRQPAPEPQPRPQSTEPSAEKLHVAAERRMSAGTSFAPPPPATQPVAPIPPPARAQFQEAPRSVQTPPPRTTPTTPSPESALVASGPTESTERSLSTNAVNPEGQMTNMGAMLMNLLARTTETQQQLAAQQGVMFETLGHHSEQLNSLSETLNNLETRIDKTIRTKR
ncbi:hypothetical protein H257_10815 [Aphanomyces astaci]|uniref:GAF domain-containing protein n=1 Tax=Aphanomyces astaci TaxID=112090 RepID=W4G5Z3_APHAT|nr:hypothetical protein H257_10815 [Aphanomyces astaci]ETV74706.1 hypothetical protein H257_10815 [Aphanomyces astaci]RQM28761.1 hypothetical protein B5M09_008150 [Aphanomyces astaci]|eukprot:XP_009835793.1 hypothetical protein H257_10815 [Aphanomyces astaci]